MLTTKLHTNKQHISEVVITSECWYTQQLKLCCNICLLKKCLTMHKRKWAITLHLSEEWIIIIEHTASGLILIWTSVRHDVFVFSLLPLQWLGSGPWWIAQKREVLQGEETQRERENIIISNPHPRIITGNSWRAYITILDMLLSSIFCINCQMQSNIPLWLIYFCLSQTLSNSQPFIPPCIFCFGMSVYAIYPLEGSGKLSDPREGCMIFFFFFGHGALETGCPGVGRVFLNVTYVYALNFAFIRKANCAAFHVWKVLQIKLDLIWNVRVS